MSTPEDLKGLYTDELKDLWSANDQMQRVLKEIAPKTSDPSLKEMLGKSVEGILKHTELLKELLAGQDEKVSKEHCRGMEGLPAHDRRGIVGIDVAPREVSDGRPHGINRVQYGLGAGALAVQVAHQALAFFRAAARDLRSAS